MSKSWYSDLPKFYQRQIKAAGLDDASISRRSMLKGTAAIGGAAALGSMIPTSALAATELKYMCWEGYNDPRISEPFEKANNVTLSHDLIVDSPAGFAKLAGGAHREFDVVSSDSPWIARMGPAGLCEYLDYDEFADIYATFYSQFKAPFKPLEHDGKATGLPTRWGWVGPAMNTDHSDPDDWQDYGSIFDDKYKNKVGLMDWGDWPILPIVLHIGINPYEEMDKAALDEFRKALRAVFKNSRALIGDVSVAQKGLLDGSIATIVGGGSYVTSGLRKQGHKNIMTVVPTPHSNGLKRGIVWMEATAILKGSQNLDLSKKLLKHVASKEVSHILSITDFTSNPVPNEAVEKLLYTDEEKSILQLDYAQTAWENSQFHRIAPNIDDLLQIWQEELAA
jgi:spermidine/putrescine transport system substrate-binding protein